MNKLSLSLTLLFAFVQLPASAQTMTIPVVPEQVRFADMTVRLDNDARRIVQQDVNALVANRQYWTAKLDRAVLYFPLIEAILADEQVPTDFKYLAVQESSLTPDAVSSSAAVGYWQFKRETATGYGLRVDDQADERKSITASTRGAAKYLKDSYAQYNNWLSSLYSYYLGASGIAKLVSPDWVNAREVSLDGRTDRYMLRFFAHKIAVESALPTHKTANVIALIEYPNGAGRSVRDLAGELSVDEFELRKYNRWILGDAIPGDKAYVVAVPVANNQINDVRQKIAASAGKKVPEFVQTDVGFPVLRRVTTSVSSKDDPVLYEINGLPGIQAQAGDNAASLARKAKLSLSSLLRYNDMDEHDPFIAGDVYYLAKKRKKAIVPFHTVRDGETARGISQRYGIRLKKLLRFNRLDMPQKLVTGRVMWLRERRPANKPVEIINAPTPPVYDQTPTPPAPRTASRPDAAPASVGSGGGSNRPQAGNSVAGLESVPRSASERKLYQPKLAGGGITPETPTAPTAAPATAWESTGTPRSSESRRPVRSGSSTTSRSMDADGSQRIVIVRTPDSAPAVASVPDAPSRSAGSAPAPTVTTSRSPSSPMSRSDRNASATERPEREQQADGSLTVPTMARTESRPVARPDARPAEPSEPKSVMPARPASAERPATPAAAPERTTPMVSRTGMHTVEAGQTYYSVSKLYGLTVEELLTLNNRTTADPLRAGERLNVTPPAARSDAPVPATTGRVGEKPVATYHTVGKGETLFGIARQYGIGMDQLREWNKLSDDRVKVGQTLKLTK